MAGSREITTVDASYQRLACRYIGGQVKALKRHLRWARFARNIEHVHQARVASRRLRAGLRMFAGCFPAGRADRWRRQIRWLTKRFGAARDADVHIEFLKQFIRELPAKKKKLRPGLKRLMLRLKQRRQAIQPKVIKALDRLDEKQVLAEITAELKAITFRCSPQHSSIRSQFVFQHARQHINHRLTGLFSLEQSLNDARNSIGHHQLRIAAKRLRYTLEICNLPFKNRLDEYIEGMKRLQSLLGKLHDCDVWLDEIKAFAGEEKARTIEYLGNERPFTRIKRGIDYFARHRRKDRKTLFEQSVQFWKQLAEQNFWGKLRLILKIDVRSQNTEKPSSDVKQGMGRCEQSR